MVVNDTTSTAADRAQGAGGPGSFPENPVLVRVLRGAHVESQHRGSWVLVDADGSVLAGAGAFGAPFFLRSAVKCLQALPLLETGAAERFGFDEVELALCQASHNAEPCHTEPVLRVLERLGLGPDDLRCGPQVPGDPATRRALLAAGGEPGAVHNNCSGKHAGLLALALQLGVAPADYLDAESAGQRLIKTAVAELSGVDEQHIDHAVDGCSAPTWHVPLSGLATAFARVTNPDGLAAERAAHCRRLTAAVGRYPELIAGNHGRICTAIGRASGGRLFPKIGAEAVYAVGEREGGRSFAVKLDDGGRRGLHAVVVALLEQFGFLSKAELDALGPWAERRVFNWAGLEVGRLEVDL